MSISAHSVATGGTGATAATAVTAATGKTVATFATFGEEEPETEARAQETDLSLIAAIPNTNPDIAAMQKKSWSSLQRTLIMCHEMDIYGKHTLEKLGEAKEKFHRLADYQGKVERDLLETATHLDDMQKCCGVFPMPWTGRRKHGPVDEDAYDGILQIIFMGVVLAVSSKSHSHVSLDSETFGFDHFGRLGVLDLVGCRQIWQTHQIWDAIPVE